jgi:hypothetical protein
MTVQLDAPTRSRPRLRARPTWRQQRRRRGAIALAPLTVAVALWVASLGHVDLNAMTDLGLVSVLPLAYFAALAVLTVGFAATLARPRGGDLVPAAYALALVAMLHATPSILYGTLRYGWAFKHVGIVDYILRHGSVDGHIGYLTAYHDWPGFFALGALATRATGQANALGIAQWAPPFFNVLFLAGVVLIARTLSTDRRVVWGTAWLFVLGNWVGQDYFSPQALVFFLYLVVVGALLRWFAVRPAVIALPARLRALPRLLKVRPRPGTAALVVAMCAVIVTSHQLTPLLLLIVTAALAVGGQTRLRGLPIIVGAMTVAWLMTFGRPFLNQNLYWIVDSIGTLGGNAMAPGHLADASRGMVIDAWGDRLLSAALIGLALAGAVRRVRAGFVDLVAGALVVCPVALLAANSYGGEILFRVYFYGLPFLALFAARAFFPTAHSGRSHRTTVAFGAVALVLLAGTCLAYYGKERMTRFSKDEVQATRWLYDTAPVGSLMVSATFDYPWAWHGYERYEYLGLTLEPVKSRRRLLKQPVATLARLMEGHPAAYLVITSSQDAAVDMSGILPAGSLPRIERALRRSAGPRARVRHPDRPWFAVVRATPRATIFRLKEPKR